jgi:histidinol-phosphate aminotransferase
MQATGWTCSAEVTSRATRRSRGHLAARATAAPAMEPSTSAPSSSAPSSTQFLRRHMLKLAPYTPIEPFEVLSARYGRRPDEIIKLDANENPYGPPPEVRAALGTMAFPHIYPDPETRALRAALSKMHNVPMENLLVRCTKQAALAG